METAIRTINKRMDEDGNSIMAIRDDNIIRLYIKLKSEKRDRKIGFINLNTKTLYVNRQREKHLFRKFTAYGFCYHVLKDAKKFNQIRLKDEHNEWLIPVSFILDKDNAKYLHFKGSGGFELQVFVPLESIIQFIRPERF